MMIGGEATSDLTNIRRSLTRADSVFTNSSAGQKRFDVVARASSRELSRDCGVHVFGNCAYIIWHSKIAPNIFFCGYDVTHGCHKQEAEEGGGYCNPFRHNGYSTLQACAEGRKEV